MTEQTLDNIQKEALGDKIPTDVGTFITNLLPYVFGLAAVTLLVFLIVGGLQMMFSQGEPKAMQSAQAKITNALIGFVIIVIAFFVVQLVEQLLGLGGTSFGNMFGN